MCSEQKKKKLRFSFLQWLQWISFVQINVRSQKAIYTKEQGIQKKNQKH